MATKRAATRAAAKRTHSKDSEGSSKTILIVAVVGLVAVLAGVAIGVPAPTRFALQSGKAQQRAASSSSKVLPLNEGPAKGYGRRRLH